MSERNRFSKVACRRGVMQRFSAALLLCLMTIGAPVIACAQSRLLDAPRAAGTVGERYDGYAVARDPVSANATALVEQVNAQRRALYAQRAKTDGVPIEAIGKIYAAEIFKSAPSGTWFLSENGQWTRK